MSERLQTEGRHLVTRKLEAFGVLKNKTIMPGTSIVNARGRITRFGNST